MVSVADSVTVSLPRCRRDALRARPAPRRPPTPSPSPTWSARTARGTPPPGRPRTAPARYAMKIASPCSGFSPPAELHQTDHQLRQRQDGDHGHADEVPVLGGLVPVCGETAPGGEGERGGGDRDRQGDRAWGRGYYGRKARCARPRAGAERGTRHRRGTRGEAVRGDRGLDHNAPRPTSSIADVVVGDLSGRVRAGHGRWSGDHARRSEPVRICPDRQSSGCPLFGHPWGVPDRFCFTCRHDHDEQPHPCDRGDDDARCSLYVSNVRLLRAPA